MKSLRSRLMKKREDQTGINMVDLMMWLVIAALLLAAAIQGIGYYQKNSYLYQMKNDAMHGAEVVSATVGSNDGKFTAEAVSAGVNDVTKTGDVTLTAESGASDANGYVLRATHPGVDDKDVLFLSAQRGAWSPGIHVVPKGTTIDPTGGTTIITTPVGGGTGGGGGGSYSPVADPSSIMTTSWRTTGTCSTITLPISGVGAGTTVDWGDGAGPQTVTVDHPSKTFSSSSTGIVVNGTFDMFGGGNGHDWSSSCLDSIDTWGDATGTTSMEYAFVGKTDLAVSKIARIPATVTNLNGLFKESNFSGDIHNWETSNVTTMDSTFEGSTFNGDISHWKTGSVTSMGCTFCMAANFNSDISGWDVSKVGWFAGTFAGATSFNQNIGGWKTDSAWYTGGMFQEASSFNQNINSWNMSGVMNSQQMFQGATSFNQPLDNWNMTGNYSFTQMFQDAKAFDQNLNSWPSNAATAYNFYAGSALSPANLPKS